VRQTLDLREFAPDSSMVPSSSFTVPPAQPSEAALASRWTISVKSLFALAADRDVDRRLEQTSARYIEDATRPNRPDAPDAPAFAARETRSARNPAHRSARDAEAQRVPRENAGYFSSS